MLSVYLLRVVMVVCAVIGSIGSVCGADRDEPATESNWALFDTVSELHFVGHIDSC
ncbi:MAG: hypothetical protein QG604_667 [Candidatus Dependentiae bacterium]|nr:hypothetical protein [Candidatus Dependentiae bacterium]